MSGLRAIAITLAKEGYEQKVRKALEDLVAPGNQERGVVQYELHVDTRNPRQFVFIEEWESSEAFDAHCNAPQIGVYWAAVEGMLERSELIVLRKVD